MSIIGTGVAAGVAQTGVQAKQAATQRNRVNKGGSKDDRDIRDAVELHLLGEEGHEDANGMRIDGQMPQHQHPPSAQPLPEPKSEDAGGATPDQGAVAPTSGATRVDKPLYHHLDMKA